MNPAETTSPQTAAAGRVESQEALKRSEERWRVLAENVPVFIIHVDTQGKIQFMNRTSKGFELDKVVGTGAEAYVSDEFKQPLLDAIRRVVKTGTATRIEVTGQGDNGSLRWYASHLSPIFENNAVVAVNIIASDITDQKVTEEALRASVAQYRLLFENNPTPIFVCDQETHRLMAANDAATRIYGYSAGEFAAMTFSNLRTGSESPKPPERPASPELQRHTGKDGRILEMEVAAHPLVWHGRPSLLVLAMDMTERRNLETQLRHSQKLDSIGRLAGGVAHDFNNVLTVIQCHASLMVETPGVAPAMAECAQEIQEAARRAAALTRQLLAFSRKQVLQLDLVDLGSLTRELLRMIRRIIGEDIKLVSRISDSLPQARADAGTIEQVIVNLVVNARDAMPQGGNLVVSVDCRTLDSSACRRNPHARAGHFLRIAVEDTGSGIPPEILPRVFEPFFTTKEKHRGTGLGLATAYGIISQHHGWIEVRTTPGQGTVFEVFLPAAEAEAAP